MNFKLPVTLYALRPRYTLNAALKARTKDVKRRFIGVTKTLSFSLAELVAWTIDTGYGTTLDQTDFLGLTLSEQRELHRYLRRRVTLLFQLVQLNSANGIGPRAFVRLLDSSEKADASFILGGLACRIAHEHWFQQRKVTVARFWHLAVYEKHASQWISSVANTGKSRPDFLVQDSQGTWFPAEAKGSFGDADWAQIQKGLRQAARLRSVTFTDPATLKTTKQKVGDFACVMGHSGMSNQFEASLVDPTAIDSAPLTLELAPEFADANSFLAAIRQYRLLGRRLRPANPRAVSDFLGYETRYLGLDPVFKEPLVIGIPMILLESERQLHAFMRVTQHFAKAFGDYFPSHSEAPGEADETNWTTFLTLQSVDTALDVGGIDDVEVLNEANRMFALAVRHLAGPTASDRENTEARTTWGTAMLRLADAPIFLYSDQNISLLQWLRELRRVIKSAALTARLEANLVRPQADSQLGPSVAGSLNGLIVIHGASPRRVRQESRRPKI